MKETRLWRRDFLQSPFSGGRTMKVSIKRTGGYAGIEESIAEIDTDELDHDSASRAKALLAEIEKLAATSSPQIGADLMRYQVTVTEGGRQRKITFADVDSPAARQLQDSVHQISALR